jgi:WD40 repeat protein
VLAVAAVDMPHGRTLLVTAGADGTVRLWDPTTGTEVGDPLTDDAGAVPAVAAVEIPDGRTLLPPAASTNRAGR